MEMPTNEHKLAVVTGGAGFIGSHLCERLVREGYRVISLDNYFTGTPTNHVTGVEYRTGHTKDIAEHIQETPDIIYHLGEYARTEKSFEDIELVWDSNKVGTFAVLEFWRRAKCKLVYAGSSTKFADGGDGKDQSPYAWSKATNTELVENYATWFGLSYAITYFYNVYGPREMSGAYGTLISIFHALHKQGHLLTVVSPGTQMRNFTHVFDIVDGLVCVGENGEGDGYGIGSDDAYSVLDVASMFGGEVLMMPERKGNRQTSVVASAQTKALGWECRHTLSEYVTTLISGDTCDEKRGRSILVFATTFYPNDGGAEKALIDLMHAMPNMQFDVVTTVFSKEGRNASFGAKNVTIHRVGYGTRFDKYLLPLYGPFVARRLQEDRTYLCMWSLFASYGALTAVLSRVSATLPLLITIADQRLAQIPWYIRFVLRIILRDADQIYADNTYETKNAISLSRRASLVRSVGDGDAFLNQIRFAYSNFLKKRIESHDA